MTVAGAKTNLYCCAGPGVKSTCRRRSAGNWHVAKLGFGHVEYRTHDRTSIVELKLMPSCRSTDFAPYDAVHVQPLVRAACVRPALAASQACVAAAIQEANDGRGGGEARCSEDLGSGVAARCLDQLTSNRRSDGEAHAHGCEDGRRG